MKKKIMTNYLVYLSLTLLGLYMSVFQRSLTNISNFFAIDGIYTGLLVSSHFTGIFLIPMVAGELADKYGRKKIIVSSFSLLFIGLIISIISRLYIFYLFALFLIGGGFGVIEGIMTTLLVDINEGKETRVINLSQAFFCIGALIGPVLTGFAISTGYTWRHLYGILAIISLFYILYFWNEHFEKVTAPEGKIKGIIVWKLVKKPVFILLAVTMFMYVGIEQGVAFWITSYVNNFGESVTIPGIILSGFWGVMIIGRIAAGIFSKKYKLINMIIGLTVFSIISLLVVILSKSYLTGGVAFVLLGLGLSAIWPLVMSVVNKYYNKFRGTAFGVMMASSALGGMIIPFLAGVIRDMFNIVYGMAFFFLPLLMVLLSQGLINYVKKDT